MRMAHLAGSYVIISRMTLVAGTNKNIMATVTGAKVNLQPLSDQKTALMGGVLGKTYKVYCDSDVDVQEHDKLRDYFTGYIFKVKPGGVTLHSYGATEYKEVLIEKIS